MRSILATHPMRAALTLALAVLLLGACASPPSQVAAPRAATERPAMQPALPPADGPLADVETGIRSAHGHAASGFLLLDRNEDALRWRLALIDAARQSIDVQVYVWFNDTLGALILQRVVAAADRGVKVRILLDDINSMLGTMTQVDFRDELFALIDSHPNIQIRLFNPWRERGLLGRIGGALTETSRLNQRMHKKQMIVDNRAIVLGGRNLADEYFGLNAEFNFRDLDVLGVGPVARQGSAVFDTYWNSRWVLAASELGLKFSRADRNELRARLAAGLGGNPKLARVPASPQDAAPALATLAGRLMPGTSRIKADEPTDTGIRHEMLGAMYELGGTARRELSIVNAYIIPDERAILSLRGLRERGVAVRVLTNSLASHDVPAVNSHYKQWRRALREAVTELHEFRHDPAVKADAIDFAPTRGGFAGLHTKAMMIDREQVYIGSMNLDPRSANLNTEMGVLIDSAPLAEALARVLAADMTPANSWRVEIEADGRLAWRNDAQTVHTQPARGFWQRVQDVIFMAFPRDLY